MSYECSRREVLRRAPTCAALARVMLSAGPRAALGQQKATKAMVQYQDSPKAGHQCSSCSNFVSPSSCKVVSGTVSPRGWCAIWTPKSA
jgi:hypothetical protein